MDTEPAGSLRLESVPSAEAPFRLCLALRWIWVADLDTERVTGVTEKGIDSTYRPTFRNLHMFSVGPALQMINTTKNQPITTQQHSMRTCDLVYNMYM